ncbi:MAG: glucosaminidase domain-containing protein [Bacteroidales bacterium]|nr:glucosaminidase domain-containing protein [Bacteroidales bacterium]
MNLTNIKYYFFILFINCFLFTYSQVPQKKITREEYIEKYKDIAIQEMNIYKIPASITLAQGILESADGNSKLSVNANNHFGIKCHLDWEGKTYYMDDDEEDECFRKYNDPYDSFKDHSYFLSERERYASLFKLKITDYKGWSHGLKKAGYATNSKYPQLLIKIIEENNLHIYDKELGSALAENTSNFTFESNQDNIQIDDFKPLSIGANNRKIFVNNDLKFIIARKGDTFYEIAQDFEIYTWQIYKYNDLKKKDKISEGQIIYLQRKKNKGNRNFHFVNRGETMYSIAQLHGIKLNKLYKKNNMPIGTQPKAGQKLWLRKKKI